MSYARFRGKYLYAIDEKGRLNIPSKFRRSISPSAQETMVVTRGTEGCLFVYPLDIWEEFEKSLQQLPLTQKNSHFRRFLLDSFSDCLLDKQGRIALSPEQIQLAQIEKEVLIVGDIDKIQLWNPSRYKGEIEKALAGTSYDQYYYDALAGLNSLRSGPKDER